MTSLKETVQVPGVLRGKGRERDCLVRAQKVTNPGPPADFAYADPVLLDPEDGFPDGDYEVQIGRQIFFPVKRNGEYGRLRISLSD
jgi:hypothetical protein